MLSPIDATLHTLSRLAAEEGWAGDLADLGAAARRYWELLQRWNAKIKLTGARDEAAFATRHLADSLHGLSVLGELGADSRLLDVGSGAGFPSIPLALALAPMDWTLAESHQRRAAFLSHLCRSLTHGHDSSQLSQWIQIRPVRVQGCPEDEGLGSAYHRILFRAVAPEQVLAIAHHYLAPDGKVLYWGTQGQEFPNFPGLALEASRPYALESGEAFALYVFGRSEV